jgi:deoxyribodipyrimidine photolyase
LAVRLWDLKQAGVTSLDGGFLSLDSLFTPGDLCPSILGIPRVSHKRVKFAVQCLFELVGQYKALSVPLFQSPGIETLLQTQELPFFPTRAQSQAFLLEDCRGHQEQFSGKTLWRTQAVGTEEESWRSTLIEAFHESENTATSGILEFRDLEPNVLIDQDEISLRPQDYPQIFSRFRRIIEKKHPEAYRYSRFPSPIPSDGGGEKAVTLLSGEERLRFYTFGSRNISTYKKTRNGLGSGDYSSRLSPYLALGNLSPKAVAKTLLDYEKKQGANESTYWLRFELLWRDFFLRLYQKHPKTFFTPRGFKKVISPGLKHGADWSYPFEQENIEVPILHKSGDKGGYYQAFLGWITGETGEPLIDASMRELFFTGFISNRSRQCAASYLINNLGVPWWWGAAWFEYHLLDYDPFSNWGNWAYLAGVGADTIPQRVFNIPLQQKKYDPQGDYLRWVEEKGWRILPEDIGALVYGKV